MSSLIRRLAASCTPFAPTLGALTVALGALGIYLSATARPLRAQYFGRNKVPYERFDFDVLRTAHFDVHYYDAEKVAARDAARMLERWNARFSSLLNHQLSARKPVVLYADQPDFQQTNVISEQLDEGTGGVTESFLDRMVLPLTGSYAESDHVLGHETVHVFQYDIAAKQRGGGRFEQLPLWLVEGMAEYLSVGPNDNHTAMWLRDAIARNDMPSIRALTNSARYFPYRYGEALWAYIGGTWGDAMVGRLFRASLERGFDEAVRRELGISVDALSKRWHDAIERRYRPLLASRTLPAETGHRLGAAAARNGEYNVSPVLSPDGRRVAYFSTRGLLGVELLVADATTGAVQASLATPGLRTRFDALSFLYSAGSWSPDGSRFAFVTYADGDNEIVIADTESRRVERRIKPRDIGAISSVAWSPDGSRLAFSGSEGGISDLFLIDLASGAVRRLTNDRYADLQPAWSPDGRSLAFVSDRAMSDEENIDAAGSDFDKLRYAPLRLALIDVTTGHVRIVPTFSDAKHLSPQFAADGHSLLFVADPKGYSDIYRVELESGRLFQITHAATGVSGIAATSPALSLSRDGHAMFSVFERGGTQLAALSAEETIGQPLGAVAAVDAGRMPMDSTSGIRVVAGYLHDAETGLSADTSMTERPYRAGFQLAAIGQPMLGVGTGGGFGTQFYGAASAYFTDILGDHSLGVALQANGSMRDVGGQVMYIDASRRWTWGAALERIPYVLGYTAISDTSISTRGGRMQGTAVDYVLAHIAVSGASLLTQFARSATQRLELQAGYSRYDYGLEVLRDVYVGSSRVASQRSELPAPSSLGMVSASVALVGDDAASGFTSPMSGTRYRLEVTPTIGSLGYQTVLADFRRYFYMRPLTLAIRGIHYGRYGRDSESDRLGAVFVGDGSLVRGYSYDSFNASECGATPTSGSLAGSSCPEFDRLVGSRIAVANVELRIPLVGSHGHGLMQTSALPPLELAPFFDVGSAWTGSSQPVLSLTRSSGERTAVASTGLALRVNLFGFAVLQSYYAIPFQRPTRSGVWGFVLQPGF